MQFTIAAAAVLAFANSVFAQNPDFNPVYKPESGEEIDAGTTYTIEWDCPDEFADVTIKISLIGGATQEGQVPLLDIASGVNNSDEEYTWEIPSDIGGEAFYGLVLTSEANPADFQFSNPFVILAGEGGGDDDEEEGESKSTTTITASQGTATVTLSKAEVTSSAISSSSVESSSEIPETSSAPVSSSAVASTTTVAQTSTVVEDEPEETTEPDTVDEEDESSAARAHAGMLALVAGVAAAAFML